MAALGLILLFWGGAATVQPDARVLAQARSLLEQQEFASVLDALDAAGPKGAHPALLRLRADAYVGLLDYVSAVEMLEGAGPEPDALVLRIRLLAMLSRDDEARAALNELLALDEDLPRSSRFELGAQLRESGLVPESRRVLGPPALGEPLAVTLERGRLRLAEDDVEGALPLLETAASAPASPAGAAYELGRALALLGRREEAVSWLRRAVAESPEDSEARFRLGQLLAQDPDADRAAEGQRLLSGYEENRLRARRRDLLLAAVYDHRVVAGSVVDGTPGAAAGQGRNDWVELLGLLLDGGDHVEATRVAQAASVRYPGDPAFEIGRARAHLLSGNPAAAAEVLAPLVPGSGETLEGASLSAARWLADARLRGGDPAAAAALFSRVLDAGGDGVSPRIRAAAATAFAMSGDPARALTLFDEVLDRTPGPARAGPLSDSALVLEMLGRPGEAESRYRQSLEADPAHTAASLGLAELLLRAGRSGEAAQVLRSALEHAPGDPALRDLLSRAVPGGGQGSSGGFRAVPSRSVISPQASPESTSVLSSPARSACTSPDAETLRWTVSVSGSLASESSPASVTASVQAAPSPGSCSAPRSSALVEFSL